jgi:LysM repeat protein
VPINRYVTHGTVLLLALVLSGYASVGHGLPGALNLRLGAVNADGLVMGEGGQVHGVAMGRASTIIAPVAIPVSAPVSHTPVTYEVKSGETLKDLSSRFQVSVDDIRWSNLPALKNPAKDVSAGQKIVIPPVDGLVVIAQKDDTPLSLSTTYHVTSQAIVDFNYLRSSDQDPLPAGTAIVIPGGRGPDLSAPVAPRTTPGGGGVTLGGFNGSYRVAAGNRFPYGYCTWYVYNRKPVPWLGNASEWFGQAQAYGWATGQTPRPGAIMVTFESAFGHVAYVESVAPDGSSWTVSEMNFQGWGIVDTRTIRRGGVPLIGFIY